MNSKDFNMQQHLNQLTQDIYKQEFLEHHDNYMAKVHEYIHPGARHSLDHVPNLFPVWK